MLRNIRALSKVKNSAYGAIICAVAGISPTYASDASGHVMLSKLPSDHRYPFIAGIIEGIAFHRYTVGAKDSPSMNCVYDWFYKDDKALDTIYVAFGKYPDYPPAAVVAALANRKCPK